MSYKNWQIEADPADGIVLLKLDSAPKQNVLHKAALRELGDIFEKLYKDHADGKLTGVVICSAKSDTFCAGADIKEIKEMFADPDGAKMLIRNSESIFSLIDMSPFPVVAAISGESLGGGLELTLFCDARIAADTLKTSLALPETMLGVIPGFGGTQNLPNLVGFQRALEVIVGGKKLGAKPALKYGLVDKVVPQDALIAEAKKLAVKMSVGYVPQRKLPLPERLAIIRGPLRAYMLRAAKKMVIAKTKGVYPAPLKAIEAIGASRRGMKRGWQREHELFMDCVRTSEAKSLVDIFLLQQEARVRNWTGAAVEPPGKVGIIGAGTMGSGIAYALLSKGIPVVLHDICPKQVAKALASIEYLFKGAVRKYKMTPQDAQAKMELLTLEWGKEFKAFSDVDLAVEAVVENIKVKRIVYSGLVKYLPKHAVIASNTSSIPLGELAAGVEDPSRFCALHFFNPVPIMDLVEIAGHPGTSSETLAKAAALVRKMKKTPVVLKSSCPGLIVNRILISYLSMPIEFLLEGRVSPEELDKACEKLGMVMGPFKTLDLVGLDVGVNVLAVMGQFYGSGKDVSAFTNAVTSGGLLGQKGGKGFYLYEKGKKKGLNEELLNKLAPNAKADAASAQQCAKEILERMRCEAQAIVDEGICEPQFVDLACVLGAGITPNRRGLLGFNS